MMLSSCHGCTKISKIVCVVAVFQYRCDIIKYRQWLASSDAKPSVGRVIIRAGTPTGALPRYYCITRMDSKECARCTSLHAEGLCASVSSKTWTRTKTDAVWPSYVKGTLLCSSFAPMEKVRRGTEEVCVATGTYRVTLGALEKFGTIGGHFGRPQSSNTMVISHCTDTRSVGSRFD